MLVSPGASLTDLLYLVLHLSSSNSFPKPLTAAEELEFLSRLDRGDKEARDTLIRRNLRLVAHIIKKYYATADEQDDLISIGTIGLIKAVDTFSTEKGTRLATYAARCIENEILMYFRNQKKLNCEMLLNDTIDTDNSGNPLTLYDILPCDDTILDSIELKMNLQKLSGLIDRCLDKRERLIVALRYGLCGRKPLTQRETAKYMGISRSYVSRIEKKALETLRAELEK